MAKIRELTGDTPREAKRQYTNRYNGMNRNGFPCKRGKR